MNQYELLDKFIQREVENTDDRYQLSKNEMKEVFKNAIQAIEELTGQKIDEQKFNEFLSYYKIMKIVERISEELRSDKYVKDMQERQKQYEKTYLNK